MIINKPRTEGRGKRFTSFNWFKRNQRKRFSPNQFTFDMENPNQNERSQLVVKCLGEIS